MRPIHRLALALAALSLALAPVPALAQTLAFEDAALDAPNPPEAFGAAIDLDGDRLLVGSPDSSSAGFVFGEASLWERQPDGSWTRVATWAPTTLAGIHAFGAGVALDGDLALVGAPGDHVQGSNTGAVYAFERQSDGTWLETATLRPTTPMVSDGFGRTLDLQGDRAVIGAPQLGYFGRAAYVFERQTDGSWIERAELVSSVPASFDGFGSVVELDGDRIAVGAPSEPFGAGPGAVFVFERQANGTWLEVERLTGGVPLTFNGFGAAVALQGDELAVGSPNGQRVHVFRRTPTAGWSEVHVIDGLGEPSAVFGTALDLDGDRLAVGSARVGFILFGGPGRIHLYDRIGRDAWRLSVSLSQLGTLSTTRFGDCLDLEGERVVGSRPNGPVGATAVSIFELGTLYHGAPTISAASGGTHDLLLRAGAERAGDAYALLGSMSGTAPGVTDPVSGLTLPLVFDMYTDLIVNSGGRSVLSPWQGVLDGNGAADATLVVPPATDPALVGLVLHHAFFTVELTPNFMLTSVSNPVRFELAP